VKFCAPASGARFLSDLANQTHLLPQQRSSLEDFPPKVGPVRSWRWNLPIRFTDRRLTPRTLTWRQPV